MKRQEKKFGLDRRTFLRLTAVVTVGSAVGPHTLGRSKAWAAAEPPVRVGYEISLWSATIALALREKFFDQVGLNVTARMFDSGKSTRDAMISGDIDIGMVGATPFIIGASKGDISAIGVAAYAGKTIWLVVGKDSGIKKVGDLKGKRLASQVGSTVDNIFSRVIAPRFGLTKGDYLVANLPFQDHVAALAAKSVDAFIADDPQPSLAEIKGVGLPILSFEEYDMAPAMLAARTKFIEAKPDLTVRLLKAWLRSAKLFKDDPKGVAVTFEKIYAERGNPLSLELVQKLLSHIVVNPEYVPGLEEYLNRQASFLREQGAIQTLPDWSRILRRDLLAKANM